MAAINLASSILGGEISASLIEETLEKTAAGLLLLIQRGLELDKVQRQLASSAAETGYSYSYLSQQAREFADAANLSALAASKVTAELAKIASGTNKFDSIPILSKAALDIKAASGLSEEQVETLFKAVRSGSSDEPLNNAGLADPGRLAEIYAAKVGKSVSSLSEAEKIQSRVDALLERAERLKGASDAYKESKAGQADEAVKSANDFINTIGSAVVQSDTFSNVLRTYSALFKGLAGDIDTVNKKLAEGKTPQEIAAEEQSGGIGSQLYKALRTPDRILGAGLSIGFDFVTGDSEGRAVFDRAGAIINPENLEYQRRVEQIANQKRQNELTDKNSKETKALLDLKNLIETDKTDITGKVGDLNEVRTNISETRKFIMERLVRNTVSDVKKANELLAQLPDGTNKEAFRNLNLLTSEQRLKELEGITKQVVSSGNVAEIRKQIADLKEIGGTENLVKFAGEGLNKLIEPALDKVKQLKEQITGIFRDGVIRGNQDNPFVKLFIDAQEQAEKLRETTRGLSKEGAATIERQFKENQERAFQKLKFETETSALKYFQQAKIFEVSQIGLNGDQQRQFDALSARLTNAVSLQKIAAQEREIKTIETGYKPNDYQIIGQTRSDIDDLKDLLDFRNDAGIEGKGLIANSILDIINKTPKNLLFGNRGEGLRREALDALDDSRSLADKQLKDELARIQIRKLEDDNALELARKAKASGSAIDIRAANEAVVAATSGRSYNELSPELYQLKIEATRNLGTLTTNYQQDSIRALNSVNDGIATLNKSFNELKAAAIEGGLTRLNVVLKNDTGQNVRAEQMPRVGEGGYGANGDKWL